MHKVFCSLLIILIALFFIPQSMQVNAIPAGYSAPECSTLGYKITIDAPEANPPLVDQQNIVIGSGRRFGVNVKIPKSAIQTNWGYYVIILSHPDLGTERANSFDQRINGGTPTSEEVINGVPYSVLHFEIHGMQIGFFQGSEFIEYAVGLKHAEGRLGFGADICKGPDKQIKTVNDALANVGNCPITMSSNFNSADPISGTANLPTIPGIDYGYRLDPGDISNSIPQSPYNPIPLNKIPGDNPRYPVFQTKSLNSGTNVDLPQDSVDNGTYTATVYASVTTNPLVKLFFSCGHRVITVSNDPTSPQTTGGGSPLPSGGGAGIPGSSLSPSQGGLIIPATSGVAPCGGEGIKTAIGCIHTNPLELTKDVLKFGMGIGGGLAFLMMLLGAFQMLTSAGNPESLQAGRERLISAVIGLLLIIFSVLLIQILGFDILGIPGFGR